jgi:hypothetical protein
MPFIRRSRPDTTAQPAPRQRQLRRSPSPTATENPETVTLGGQAECLRDICKACGCVKDRFGVVDHHYAKRCHCEMGDEVCDAMRNGTTPVKP